MAIVGDLVKQAGFTYFYGKQVDKTEAMVRRMTQDLYQKVLSITDTVSNDVSLQQLDMVNHLLILLQNFGSIFSEEMNKPIDKINAIAKERLAQLDTLVYNCTKGLLQDTDIQAQLKKYEALAQVYLTINGAKPVITGVFPTCISPLDKTSAISINCVGCFPNVGDRSMEPTFMLKGQKFKPNGNINNVQFSIPYSLLFAEENQAFTSLEFNVRIPHPGTSWPLFSRSYFDFKGWISLLPTCPGTFTLQYTVVKETEEQQPRSAHFWQDSRKVRAGGIGFSQINKPYALQAGEGWSILPGSAKIQTAHMQGDGTSARLHSEGPAAAIFVVTTHFNQKNNRAGRVECVLTATAVKINKIIEERTKPLDLKWGDSFELNPTIYKDWKITFEAFNKTKTEYRGNADDSFISIQSPQGIPILKVKVPQTLSSNFESRASIRANL